jgi:hypothetical protein
MSETVEHEVSISQSALAELVKATRARGGNLTIAFQSMVGVGAYGLASICGGERAAELVRNVADSEALRVREGMKNINWAEPDANDHRVYAASALDGAPPSFNRRVLRMQALIHAGLSLGATDGADDVIEVLRDLISQIEQMAADRTLRSGHPEKDLN